MQENVQTSALFKPGESGNPAGSESRAARRKRIEALVASWCEPVGVTLSPAERLLAERAADLSLRHFHGNDDMLKQTALLARLLALCGLARTVRLEQHISAKRPAAWPYSVEQDFAPRAPEPADIAEPSAAERYLAEALAEQQAESDQSDQRDGDTEAAPSEETAPTARAMAGNGLP